MRGEPGREKEGDKGAAVPIIRTGGDAREGREMADFDGEDEKCRILSFSEF